MEKIDIEVRNNRNKNVAVFGSSKHNFLKSVSLPVDVNNQLIVDSSPYIRPLARINDEWESFTLVLVSSNYAKIFTIMTGIVEDIKKLSADIMKKHKKGGWSQARFNRLRKEAIHSFFTKVLEALEKRVDERIIIAGPGTAKNHFMEMLPSKLKSSIVAVLDFNVQDENEILKESVQIISEQEELKSHKNVLQLKSEIIKDGLAVYGIRETIQALKNGQVDILLIEKDYQQKGWICEHCQIVDKGTLETCPYCNNQTSEVDILEELIEFAERTEAEVEFSDDEILSQLGHVGGLLRYK